MQPEKIKQITAILRRRKDMKAEVKKIKVRDLVAGYEDGNNGTLAYNKKLVIRPGYMYDYFFNPRQASKFTDEAREMLANDIMNGCQLYMTHWAKESDGTYGMLYDPTMELVICDFVTGMFAVNGMYFHNLRPADQEKILNYTLLVSIFEGTTQERMDWLRRVAGEKSRKRRKRR
jgi:hypothetical protein